MTICTLKHPRKSYPKFLFSGLHESRPVIHEICVARDVFVEVVGDGDNGCYDWVIRKEGKITQHSDDGYGEASLALRDGLLVYHTGGSSGQELLDQWVQAQCTEERC